VADVNHLQPNFQFFLYCWRRNFSY